VPRLTFELYRQRHVFLKRVWEIFGLLFAVLPADQQWAVHSYYVPTLDLDDLQLRAHRKEVSERDPSLPNRAGKAYLRLERVFDLAAEEAQGDDLVFHRVVLGYVPGEPTIDAKGRSIKVAPVARPEPDMKALARAIVDWKLRELQAEQDEAA